LFGFTQTLKVKQKLGSSYLDVINFETNDNFQSEKQSSRLFF